MLVWASLVPPLPLLGLSLLFEGPGEIGDALAGVDPAGIGALLFVALAAGLFGFAAWTLLLKRHAAAAVTPFALLVPVFGIASAALLLGERPSGLELGGAALICAGLAATLDPRAALRGQGGRRLGAQPHGVVRPAVLGIDLRRVGEHEAGGGRPQRRDPVRVADGDDRLRGGLGEAPRVPDPVARERRVDRPQPVRVAVEQRVGVAARAARARAAGSWRRRGSGGRRSAPARRSSCARSARRTGSARSATLVQ